VILADDSVLFREGLARLLAEAGIEVVAQCGDAVSLGVHVAELRPDLVITDIRMPPTFTVEGLKSAIEIRHSHPEVGVVVLSQYVETGHAVKLIEDGGARVGYFLKDKVVQLEDFVDGLRRVTAGGSSIDPAVVSQLLNRRRQVSALDELTERERGVLALMAEGRSNHAIGDALHLGEKTIESYVRSIFMKLDLPLAADDHRRVRAVLLFLKANSTAGAGAS
jgi:DNA-binding NarL/FixJ family response regulator